MTAAAFDPWSVIRIRTREEKANADRFVPKASGDADRGTGVRECETSGVGHRNGTGGPAHRPRRLPRGWHPDPAVRPHPFMGWALSVQGRLDEATDECRRAIEIDP